jgi:hypothetical protein
MAKKQIAEIEGGGAPNEPVLYEAEREEPPVVESPPKKAAPAKDVYTTDELAAAAPKLFGASQTVAYAALKAAGVMVADKVEAARVIRDFQKKEVK